MIFPPEPSGYWKQTLDRVGLSGDRGYEAGVHAGCLHLLQQYASREIVANFADRKHTECTLPRFRHRAIWQYSEPRCAACNSREYQVIGPACSRCGPAYDPLPTRKIPVYDPPTPSNARNEDLLSVLRTRMVDPKELRIRIFTDGVGSGLLRRGHDDAWDVLPEDSRDTPRSALKTRPRATRFASMNRYRYRPAPSALTNTP